MSIEVRFARLLVEMETVSFGAVKSFKPTSTGGKEPPTVQMYGPNRDTWPLHLKWREIWAVTSEAGKPEVFRVAREELETWKARKAPLPRRVSSEEDWIILDGEGHPPADVARKFRTSERAVRRLRAERDRDPETGSFVGDAPRVVEARDRESRVLLLHARGLSTREIVQEMDGIQQTQVMRILARARSQRAA